MKGLERVYIQPCKSGREMWSKSHNPTLSYLKVQHRAKAKCSHTTQQHLAHPLREGHPPNTQIPLLPPEYLTFRRWIPSFLPPQLLLGAGRFLCYLFILLWDAMADVMCWEATGRLIPTDQRHICGNSLSFGGLLLKQETLMIPCSCNLPDKIGQLKK